MLIVHLLAQAAAAAAPEAAAAPTQGVISYPPSYFAAQQPSNASDMVARLPGFSLDTGDSVRGFEGAAGNVLIDGQRPSSKTDNLEEILRRIPAGQVERIDVIRGGAPGIDMQGKTVLANVIRKKSGGTRLLTAMSQNHTNDGRTMQAFRLEANGDLPGGRKWEIGTFAGKGLDDGVGEGAGVVIYPDGTPPDLSRIRGEADGVNFIGTGVYETPLFGGRARINGRLATDKFKLEEDNEIYSPTPGLETTDDLYLTDDTEIGGNYTRPITDRTTLELVGLRQSRDRTITSTFVDVDANAFVFDLERQSSETIGRAVVKYRFDERLSFEAGGETALNKLDSHTAFLENAVAQDLPAANVQVEELRNEAFLKSAWRPSDAWTVDAGVRFERSTISSEGDVVLEKTLQFVKPRVAVTWAPRPDTQVRLRIEREVGQLNFDDFVASSNFQAGTGVVAGNPDIDPQQAWVAEAEFEQRFWARGVVVLTLRHSELSDVIDRGPVFTDDGVFDTPTNIGEGRKDHVGINLTLPLDRLGWKGAQLKGDVAKIWSEVTDPTTGEKREISGQRPLDWNASFVHDIPRWNLSWGVDSFGAWRQTYYRFNLIETVKLKTYVKPFIEWRPAPDVNIRFEIGNATARGLRRTVQVYPGPRSEGGQPIIIDRDYQPGRTFYFRVRKTFG
ncbi:TonB-dependent receptor plug domain-containing protein [Phenylobacterium sp.]|jgi:outer membrane receptor protein involved in Fe transport|uniref:TonB-dependent receptor plug domain-containing protein n=1 Tax=Phenylobacterium sp. TaxID=1871053 RepID=UPI002F95FC9C